MTIDELQKYLESQRRKYFLKSFLRKAKRLICNFTPLDQIPAVHLQYKKALRTSTESQTFPPKTFSQQPSPVKTTLKEVVLYGLKEVWIVPDSTIFLSSDLKNIYYEKIIDFSDDYTLLYNSNTLCFHSQQLAKVINLPKKKIVGDGVFFGGTFSFNYFHFLIEFLPKFQFIKEIPDHEKMTFIFDESAQNNENLKTLLSFFTQDQETVFLSSKSYYGFDTLWHLTLPNSTVPNIGEGEKYRSQFTVLSKDSVKFVREICLKSLDSSKVRTERKSKIFFARKSEFRKYNEQDLIAVAEEFGFEPVYLEDYNIHEQIFLIQNADYIAGPSGAAWTNIIFSNPKSTKGLMWLGNVWSDFSVFSTLAEFVDFDLYHLRFDSPESKFHSDYYISPDLFREHLQKLLAL